MLKVEDILREDFDWEDIEKEVKPKLLVCLFYLC